ncbi:MAG: uroporphyrinogen decarboxylase family protein [Eubacteriales bacterium]
MKKNIMDLYTERVKRFSDVISGVQPDKVPVLALIDNWAIYNAGYSLMDIINDLEKHAYAYEKVLQDFQWDATFFEGLPTPMQLLNDLGGSTYRITESIQIESGSALCMEDSEYPQLTKDPYKFIRDIIFPRKYDLLKGHMDDETYRKITTALTDLEKFNAMKSNNKRLFKEKYGMPVPRKTSIFHPTDLLLDFLRDFNGIILDVKRRPDQVLEASMAMLPLCLDVIDLFTADASQGEVIFMPMHLPQFLKPKDFEKVYWPAYKKIVEHANKKDCKILCYFESKYEHLYEYLLDLPKNSIIGLFEKDDMIKAKKILGNHMCIAGGMETNLLQYGTSQECIDHAKKMVDHLAPGGGYIFTTDLILHSQNDGSPENIKAVNDFVFEYGIY